MLYRHSPAPVRHPACHHAVGADSQAVAGPDVVFALTSVGALPLLLAVLL
jgi:hypothetical protein